jgi:hypothetical protein
MKKYLILYKILFISLPAVAQLNLSPGAKMVANGAVKMNLQNIDLTNYGVFTPGGSSTVLFSGNVNNNLGGSGTASFNELVIAKGTDDSLFLQANTTVNGKITFTSGFIALNQKTILLGSNALLNNETETSRITGVSGGEITITVNLNKPNGINPGNLGAIFTSNSNMGAVTVKRGHKDQTGNGLTGGIDRYYNLQIGGKKVNATTLRLKYFDAELNTQDENTMTFYQSTDNGSNWVNQSFSNRDVVANWVEKTAMTSLGILTLSNNVNAPIIVHSADIYSSEKTTAIAKKITVGPNPNNGNFWFMISGIDKESIATIFTVDGKIIKQFRIGNLQRQQVNDMKNGIYILKVDGLAPFRIIVQGDSDPVNSSPINNNSNKF